MGSPWGSPRALRAQASLLELGLPSPSVCDPVSKARIGHVSSCTCVPGCDCPSVSAWTSGENNNSRKGVWGDKIQGECVRQGERSGGSCDSSGCRTHQGRSRRPSPRLGLMVDGRPPAAHPIVSEEFENSCRADRSTAWVCDFSKNSVKPPQILGEDHVAHGRMLIVVGPWRRTSEYCSETSPPRACRAV